jgi:2-keto-3-deoxy-L-rhamnonate aldolase RhmA
VARLDLEPGRRLRARVREGAPALGSLMLEGSPFLVEVFAEAGWDFLLLDLEHGLHGADGVRDLLRAQDAARLPLLARTPLARLEEALPWLDAGLAGLLVTGVDGPEAARALVDRVRFPPLGRRSLNPFVRAARYGVLDPASLMRAANEALLLWVLVEEADVAAAGAIARVPGVDGLVVGPYDLSRALGHPGEVDHPEVEARVEAILAAARGAGVAAGGFARDAEAARRLGALGAQVLLVGVDADLLRRGLVGLRRALGHGPV